MDGTLENYNNGISRKDIPKVLGPLNKIKLNDLKQRLETIGKASPSQKDHGVDSLTWKIVALVGKFSIDISNG